MPHGGVANARSLTARDANRPIIKCFCDARHLRTVSERSSTIFTIVRSGTVERAPASYASRRIEWVQPQFGSGARRAPPVHGQPPVSRLEWDPVVKDFIDNLDGNPLEIDKREKKGVK